MTTFSIGKFLSSLPGTLVAGAVYLVRVGTGFDLYAVDDTGSLAYKLNKQLGSIVTAVPITGGVATIDLSLGDYFTINANANFSLNFVGFPSVGMGRTISITVSQDATGGRTMALPAGFKAIGGTDTAIQSTGVTKITAESLDRGVTWGYTMAKRAA